MVRTLLSLIFLAPKVVLVDLNQDGIACCCVIFTCRSTWLPEKLPPPPQIRVSSERRFFCLRPNLVQIINCTGLASLIRSGRAISLPKRFTN